MKITINRDLCQHGGAFADRCLAATIRSPLGHEHYCIAQMEQDGQPELTVVMILDGQAHTLILHNEAEKELAAGEGWPAFIKAGI
jgi:hypothetical protein